MARTYRHGVKKKCQMNKYAKPSPTSPAAEEVVKEASRLSLHRQ